MNKERGEIELTIGKVAYTLRPTHEAMAQIEGLTGMGICEVAQNSVRSKCSTVEIVAVLYTCILAAENESEPKDISKFSGAVYRAGLANFMSPIMGLLNTMMAGETVKELKGKKDNSTDTDDA